MFAVVGKASWGGGVAKFSCSSEKHVSFQRREACGFEDVSLWCWALCVSLTGPYNHSLLLSPSLSLCIIDDWLFYWLVDWLIGWLVQWLHSISLCWCVSAQLFLLSITLFFLMFLCFCVFVLLIELCDSRCIMFVLNRDWVGATTTTVTRCLRCWHFFFTFIFMCGESRNRQVRVCCALLSYVLLIPYALV